MLSEVIGMIELNLSRLEQREIGSRPFSRRTGSDFTTAKLPPVFCRFYYHNYIGVTLTLPFTTQCRIQASMGFLRPGRGMQNKGGKKGFREPVILF